MSVIIKVENQINGSDQLPAAEMARRTQRVFDNPKFAAVWAMESMMEAHIEMAADYTMTTAEIETNLSAEHARMSAREFMADMLDDFRIAVMAAIDDPEFCKVELKQLILDRNADGTYAMSDADVRMDFDFKGKRV